MRKLLVLGIALSVFSLTSCNESTGSGLTDLKVTAKGSTEVILQILPANNDVEVIDTLKSDDGNFEITFPVDTPNFFMISTDGVQIPFFSEGSEQILIEIDPLIAEVDRGYNIKANKESVRLREVNMLLLESNRFVDSLSGVRIAYRDSANGMAVVQQTQLEFQNMLDRGTTKLLAMLDEDPANMANLFIFQSAVYNNPFLNPRVHMEYFEEADSVLIKAYPANPHVLVYQEQYNSMRKQMEEAEAIQQRADAIAPGVMAPEISLPKPDGTILSLSDLRGEVVLIDFWASWCRPCRAANPVLVEMYNEYKDQGFTVYSVSLDGQPNQRTPAEDWVKAIADDNLSWDHHVADLLNGTGEASKTYGVRGIPFTVLVDREGKVVSKQFHPSQLPTLLEGIL